MGYIVRGVGVEDRGFFGGFVDRQFDVGFTILVDFVIARRGGVAIFFWAFDSSEDMNMSREYLKRI